MKILLCHNYYQYRGGEDQSFEQEAAMLRQHGHQVQLYTRHNDDVKGMSRGALARKTIWNQDTYSQVSAMIRQERPDVMHCNNTFPLISPAVYQAAKDQDVPVVQSLRNFRLLCPNALFLRDSKVCHDCLGKAIAWPAVLHRCYRGSLPATAVTAAMLAYHRRKKTWQQDVDRYIALTEFSRNKFIEGGLPAERISVKCNFLDPDPGVGSRGGGYAVFVGRLATEKGIDTLLSAWAGMKGSMRLKIIGEGPLTEVVSQAAEQDDRIEYLGFQPLDEVCKIVGQAACLIMPSIWYETFGRTIVEAFAVGTPTIVSDLGAMSELVTDGKTGFVFEPGNSQDLAEKVQQLLDDPRHKNEMRQAARAEYEEKYTAEVNCTQLLDIYRQAGAQETDKQSDLEATLEKQQS